MAKREEIISFIKSTGNWEIPTLEGYHIIANSKTDPNLMIELNNSTMQIYSLKGEGPASLRACFSDIEVDGEKLSIPSISSIVPEIVL